MRNHTTIMRQQTVVNSAPGEVPHFVWFRTLPVRIFYSQSTSVAPVTSGLWSRYNSVVDIDA